MDTKSFLKQIRSIIREEIEYALDKKLSEKKKQKPVSEQLQNAANMYKQMLSQTPQQKPKKNPTATNKKLSGIQSILEETRRSLEENFKVDESDRGREMFFDTNSLNAFAGERMGTINAVPSGVNPNEIAPEVAQALTRDYSALMAKINEKKGVK